MMESKRNKNTFSLLELLVVIGVIAVLAAIATPLINRARSKTDELYCINNIRNLSMAVQMYHNEHGSYPPSGAPRAFRQALEPHLNNGGEHENGSPLFRCPATASHNGLEYAEFYAPRPVGDRTDSEGRDNYFIGCPYHGVVAFAPGKGTTTPKLVHVAFEEAGDWKSAKQGRIYPPAKPKADEEYQLTFGKDPNSTLTRNGQAVVRIKNGQVLIVNNFKHGEGKSYGVIRMYDSREEDGNNREATVEVEVLDGNKFDVITPAAIAGVAGTRFDMTLNSDETQTKVKLWEGEIHISGSNPDQVGNRRQTTLKVEQGAAPEEASFRGGAQRQYSPPPERTDPSDEDRGNGAPRWWPPFLPWPPWPF